VTSDQLAVGEMTIGKNTKQPDHFGIFEELDNEGLRRFTAVEENGVMVIVETCSNKEATQKE
jgi:hypothetical protein